MSLALQSFLPFPNGCQGTSPHQQGRGTKMTEHCYCGIDVAKERLDVQVCRIGLYWRVAVSPPRIVGWMSIRIRSGRSPFEAYQLTDMISHNLPHGRFQAAFLRRWSRRRSYAGVLDLN